MSNSEALRAAAHMLELRADVLDMFGAQCPDSLLAAAAEVLRELRLIYLADAVAMQVVEVDAVRDGWIEGLKLSH